MSQVLYWVPGEGTGQSWTHLGSRDEVELGMDLPAVMPLPVGLLERADAGAEVSGTVMMKKCLLCAEHQLRSIPWQHLTKPSAETAVEAGSINPLLEGWEASERRRGPSTASPVPGARAGLPPRPGQKQGL